MSLPSLERVKNMAFIKRAVFKKSCLAVEHVNVAKLKLVGLTVLQIVAAHTEGEHLRCGVLEVESRCDEQRMQGCLFAVRNLRVVRSDLSHLFAGRGVIVSERIAPLGACLLITQVLLI